MNEETPIVQQNPIPVKNSTSKSYTLWIVVGLVVLVIAAIVTFMYFNPQSKVTKTQTTTAITSTTDLDNVSQELDQTDLNSYDSELDQNTSDASSF